MIYWIFLFVIQHIALIKATFLHTVPLDDYLQEAGPHFDSHEKGMKNALEF